MTVSTHTPDEAPLAMLVAIYDIYAMGARHIHAALCGAGYNADLLFFRQALRKDGVKYTYRKRHDLSWPSNEDYRALANLLSERRPAVVGISLRSFALDMAREITRTAHEACGATVVWGGAHPTLLPEECIEYADVVCLGEGEGPFVDIVRAVSEGRSLDNIKNLWIKKANGEVVKNPLRPLLQDLDSLPFLTLEQEGKFFIESGSLYRHDPYLFPGRPLDYSVIASRGCPYKCSFCSNDALRQVYSGLGKYYRTRSPRNIISELKQAKQCLDVRTVSFQEENFSTRSQWYEELFGLYKKEIGLPFAVELHPNSADENFAKAAKEAGAYSIAMGIQSGSEDVRHNLLCRPGPDRKILAAVRAFHEQGMALWLDLIFNNPFETSEHMQQTIEFILSLPMPYNLKMYSLCYLPRTGLTDRALREDVISEDMLDQYSKLGATELMASYHNAISREHAFYVTLAWASILKFSRKALCFTFFSNDFYDGKHVVPRSLLRKASRSNFLRKHPRLLHAFLAFMDGPANRALVILRKRRALIRMARQRDWQKIRKKAAGLLKRD